MFSLQELIEYFEGQYTEDQIKSALNKINAETDDQGKYSATIAQRLEAAFQLANEAARQLPQGDVKQAQELAIQLANERAIELNLDTNSLDDIVQLIVSEGMAEAVFRHQLKQQVVDRVTADLNSQELQNLNDENARRIAKIATILSDPENLDRIIQEFGGSSEAEIVQRQQSLAANADFNVDAFFAEVDGEKKPVEIQISSVQDTKRLATALLLRCKKSSGTSRAASS